MGTDGRELALYEDTHAQSTSANLSVHAHCVETLHRLAPDKGCPVNVADAGSKSCWFGAVRALGGDFVGRVGRRMLYGNADGARGLVYVERLFRTAIDRGKYVCEIMPACDNALCLDLTARCTTLSHGSLFHSEYCEHRSWPAVTN